MAPIDLSQVPLVDNHCHGIYPFHTAEDVYAWRWQFSESRDPAVQHEQVATTLFYTRLQRELAAFLGCAPEEEEVLAARRLRDGAAWIRDLLRDAGIETLVIDRGYPPADQVAPDADFGDLAGCRTAPVLRLEDLLEQLIISHAAVEDVGSALQEALADIRGHGFVALKTIVAYRTGLDIRVWPSDRVQTAFRRARQVVTTGGSLRLAHKPLLDTLLHVAFALAARQEVPVQFHTGYGDTDADLLVANPLHLRAVLERPEYRAMPVVLLHECYPYTREGGYLAAMYQNVYLDLSYGCPFLGFGEMLAFTRAAFGVAPSAKLLYSSDGAGVPEIHWASARHGRRVLGQVLGELVEQGDLSVAEARRTGVAVLRENATRLYRL